MTQQLQTSNLEISHLQTKVFDLRTSAGGINPPNVETEKVFEIGGKNILLLLVKVFGIGRD